MDVSWQVAPLHPRLSPFRIELWCISIPDWLNRQQELFPLLSAVEQDRANRFKFERHRNAFSITRSILRLILGQYLEIKPQSVSFVYTSHGKPFVAEPWSQTGLQFNVSHSHEMAVYAIAQDHMIGVDLEHIRPVPDLDQLVKRFFSPQESTAFGQIQDTLKVNAFFRGWTQKEAFLKAIGTGLSCSLNQVEVSLSPQGPAALLGLSSQLDDTSQNWQMLDFEPASGYIGALAWHPRCLNEDIAVVGYWVSGDYWKSAH